MIVIIFLQNEKRERDGEQEQDRERDRDRERDDVVGLHDDHRNNTNMNSAVQTII